MRAALHVVALIAVVAFGGCGDDGGSTPNPPPAAATAKAAGGPGAPGAAGTKGQLPEKLHIEDRVACAVPDRPSDPTDGKCDPKAPSCGEHLYCLQLAQGTYCEPCPERDGIRHVFKERDFAVQQNRDPFEAGGTPGTGGEMAQPPTPKCRRDDQFVASSYSYLDLKLVGIVAQGTQSKVLMMGGPLGYIIKRGDCVGKEKAVVTDIGTGYVTFQIEPDATATNQRPPSEYSVQLNPKQLAVNDPNAPPMSAPRTTIAPVVAPPPVIPPAAPTRPGSGSAAVPTVTPPPMAPATAPPAVPATTPPAGTAQPAAPTIAPQQAAPTMAPPTVSPSGIAPPVAPPPPVVPRRP